MKKFLWIPLLFSIALINYLADPQIIPDTENTQVTDKSYKNGLALSELSNYTKTADYDISVELNPQEKKLTVEEKITWFNTTDSRIDELQFHFYPNAFKSNNTTYAKKINIPENARTSLNIKRIFIDNEEKVITYFSPDDNNPNDSTVGKVNLVKPVNPGDSVNIEISYSLKVPAISRRFGSSKNFYLITQWFPKLGVFQNGEWITNQYHFETEFFSDFADYEVYIKVPEDYEVSSTGVLRSRTKENGYSVFTFVQKAVHDFAWSAAKDFISEKRFYTTSDDRHIEVELFHHKNRDSYVDRYFKAAQNTLGFMEEEIGNYPYKKITVVDMPVLNFSAGMEYPGFILVNSELLSPIETLYPEKTVIHELIHQYFYAVAANNEVSEAWLDEGLTSYLTNKIVNQFYNTGLIYFKLVNYLPVYGLNILSYNEIPFIYFLGKFELPEEASSMQVYYNNLSIGSIADTSYKLPDYLSYASNSYYKPKLMFLSLEKVIGTEKLFEVLNKYYNEYKFDHPTGRDLLYIIQKETEEDLSWFFKNVYEKPFVFDYIVKEIKRISSDEYEILLERLGDGVFHTDIAVYTESDTFHFKWNDDEKWKILNVKSEDEITAVEIDPERKNLLDINFANNSYTTERKIWAPLSLSIRWLFWLQNALMILGSVG